MKKLFLLIFLLMSSQVWGATYYASPSGSGSTCSISSKCTLTYAFNTKAQPGDTVIATAGTYTSVLTLYNKHGSSGLPITIQGELDGSGNRLAIFDTSTTITGWVTAPEKGTGVYKKSGIGYRPGAMSIVSGGESYSIPRLCTSLDSIPAGCSDTNLNELATAAAATWTTTYQGGTNPLYWDGIEAMFGSDATYTYIRFRNGDAPSGYTIKATPPGNIITLGGCSYITIKNLDIKASTTGITITTYLGPQNPSSYITLDNNRIYNGALKISSTGTNITLSNNILFQQSYGELITGDYFGPWICTSGYCTGDSAISEHLYQFFKYKSDNGSNGRQAGGIFASGSNHTIYGNNIYKVEDAIGFIGSSAGANVYSNTMHDHDSACLFLQGGTANTAYIHDNLCYNATDAFRYGSTNLGGGPLYIYGNRFWQPQKVGRHMYWHFDLGSGQVAVKPTVWFYHNSWSGGSMFESISSWYSTWSGNPMLNLYFVNNISSTPNYDGGTTNVPIGLCGENWLSGTNISSYCSSSTNVNNGTTIMTGWDTVALHDFTPATAAIDAGIDISQTFVIDSVSYNALPGYSASYFIGSNPDMGAIEDEAADVTAPSIPANPAAVVSNQINITVSYDASTDNLAMHPTAPYEIYRCSGAACTATVLLATTTGTSYVDIGLAFSTIYRYRIKAVDAVGNTSDYSTAAQATTDAAPLPATPTSKEYTIYRTARTINMSLSDCNQWADAAAMTISNTTTTATIRTLFDSTALYMCACATDPTINYDEAADAWENDGIEWVFDTDNAKEASMEADDYYLALDVSNKTYKFKGPNQAAWGVTVSSASLIVGTVNDDAVADSLYCVKWKVTWASWGISAPTAGTSWGCDVSLVDTDVGGAYDPTHWTNSDGGSFLNPSGGGTCTFSEYTPSVRGVGSGGAVTIGSGGPVTIGR